MTLAIWWIRRDLRLQDNPALQAALGSPQGNGRAVLPVFILDPVLLAKPAQRRQAFLFAGLRALAEDLRARGSQLVIRSGVPQDVLAALLAESGAQAIYAGEDVTPYARRRDAAVARTVPLHLVQEVTIHPTAAVTKADGSPYTVFTPFRNAWQKLPFPSRAAWQPPERFPQIPLFASESLPETPPTPGFPAGEAEARRRLARFIDGPIFDYADGRNRLDLEGTSALSPYLRFGMLSALQAARAAQQADLSASFETDRNGCQTWLNELIWREFYLGIVDNFPHVLRMAFRPALRNIPWRDEQGEAAADLHAWQTGRTGYPAVDACMRQMAHTGWMHNRGRMIAASFLTKDLLINWQVGEDWFMRQLVDGDPAANNGGWQWTAGTGTDAAPYFRIFNPVLQGKKFDPHGDYIRRWVPELAALPDTLIHEPWRAPQSAPDYTARIVEHAAARERVLSAYRKAA